MAEWLGEVSIEREDVATVWLHGVQRTPFTAIPDNRSVDTVDRIIAIATTQKGVKLDVLRTEVTVQQVIDGTRASGTRSQNQAGLWTAMTLPLKIRSDG
jgi:hypothetical protein